MIFFVWRIGSQRSFLFQRCLLAEHRERDLAPAIFNRFAQICPLRARLS